MSRIPLIIIVGPTASGKSALAIKLAKKFNGEIVSADSRQVYRGMDIGTGKVTKQERRMVPHHLLDIASPRIGYPVSRFQKDAVRAIADIHRREHVPILAGGTPFWIDAVAYHMTLPGVQPNVSLRKKLARHSASALFDMLTKLDPVRARTIDRHNPYRLIRAIEIVRSTKKPVPALLKSSPYDIVWIGIAASKPELHRRIHTRLMKRMKQGLIAEVKNLLKSGISQKRLIAMGLEYRYVTLYLQGKLTKNELLQQLETAIRQYAKRQLTWWKRNEKIHWITNIRQTEKVLRHFIR